MEGGMNKRTAPALPTGPPHAIGPATLPAPPPPLPTGPPGEYLGGRVLPEGEFWKIFPVIQVLNYTEPTRTPDTQRISIDRKTTMGNPFIHNKRSKGSETEPARLRRADTQTRGSSTRTTSPRRSY